MDYPSFWEFFSLYALAIFLEEYHRLQSGQKIPKVGSGLTQFSLG